MRITVTILALAATAVLAACEAGPRQVNAAPPTVTYSYDSRDDRSEIEQRAASYCGENYGQRAYLVDEVRVSGGYEATFACE